MENSKRDKYLRRNYNLSEDEWESVLLLQGGGCFGCGRPGLTRALHTDHSHRTKVVRGILCAACNSALRKMKDDPNIARNLAAYLDHPPAVTLLGERKANVKVRRRKRRDVVGRKQGVQGGAKAKRKDLRSETLPGEGA